MTPAGNAHLYPPPVFNLPPADPRLVRDFTHGRQWGVDVARFGKPYVFARYAPEAQWVLNAGPFVDDAAAVAYVEGLGR